MAKLVLIAGATADVISVDELRAHLRIMHNEQNELLKRLIQSATAIVERETGRQLMPATYEYQHDVMPASFAIYKLPFNSFVSCKYVNEAGSEVTLTNDTDFAIDPAEPATVKFTNVITCKAVHNAIQFRFKAGYANTDAVPHDIKLAIMLIASRLYVNPEDPVTQLTTLSDRLISSYRVYECRNI